MQGVGLTRIYTDVACSAKDVSHEKTRIFFLTTNITNKAIAIPFKFRLSSADDNMQSAESKRSLNEKLLRKYAGVFRMFLNVEVDVS